MEERNNEINIRQIAEGTYAGIWIIIGKHPDIGFAFSLLYKAIISCCNFILSFLCNSLRRVISGVRAFIFAILLNEKLARGKNAPAINRGLGSKPFDGEGVKVEKRELVSNGKLNTWILNTSTAKKLGLKTTGNASRSVGSPPGVSTSNLYMTNGLKS